jgi:hypothetical protein
VQPLSGIDPHFGEWPETGWHRESGPAGAYLARRLRTEARNGDTVVTDTQSEKQSTEISGRGGARPGAGRPRGSPNRSTAEIRELARKYVPDALAELARLSRAAESEAVRVAAIKELLDRGYGKAPQALAGDADNSVGVVGRVEMIIIEPGVPRAPRRSSTNG